MGKRHRILIAEDHTILREGLRSLLEGSGDFEVVGEASDGREAIRRCQDLAPDALLMDLSMPKMNGLDAIREIKKRSAETKVVVLTVHKTEEYILSALRAGADAYVLKDASKAELLMAVTTALEGKRYLSPDVSDKVINGYLEGRRTLKGKTSWDSLTQREKEILKLVAEGYKNREIANYLCISLKTVEKHRANLMRKLDLHNSAALVALAIEKGLIAR